MAEDDGCDDNGKYKVTEEDKNRLADTNMENYGGKEHRDKQKAIADKQPEWFGCGEKVGIEVWRIEKFRVKHWPKEDYGTFFDGDSFIVLNTYKPPDKDTLLYNVHFWLGTDTSQDEAGTAAIKTVELDDKLGDLPVQYREVQGHETKHFRNLFPSMNIVKGGVDSGFRHVEPETYQPRLLHISGKPKKMETREVDLHVDSLNNDDAFVLDHGDVLYQFRPPHCSAWEKQASNKFVNDLSSMRAGKVKKKHIVTWDDDENDSSEIKKFWSYFGGKPGDLPAESEKKKVKDAEEKGYDDFVNKLFHVTDENGSMEIELKQEGVLDNAILKEEDDDVLIVDVGRVVYVWIGSTANKAEIRSAMKYGMDYITKTGRPNYTPIKRIFSGSEPSDFRKCFGVKHVPKDIV